MSNWRSRAVFADDWRIGAFCLGDQVKASKFMGHQDVESDSTHKCKENVGRQGGGQSLGVEVILGA